MSGWDEGALAQYAFEGRTSAVGPSVQGLATYSAEEIEDIIAAAEARGWQRAIDALRGKAASLASSVAQGTWGWAYAAAADYLESIANQATPAQEETAK